MKYRLKDRQLQKKLDDISNGDFSRQLDYVVSMSRNHDPFITTRPVYFELDHDTRVVISIDVTPDMVVENSSYNPKAWNKFPEVEPPEDVWMRCVMTDIHHNNRIVRVGAKFSTGAWRDHEGVAFEPRFRVDKFKPWDDEE